MAGALLALVAVPAQGAQGALDQNTDTVIYTGEGAENNDVVVRLVTFNGSPHYEVYDPGAVITAATPCLDFADGTANPNTMDCPANLVTNFSSSLGDGADRISVVTPLPTSIGGGAGNDVMTGGPAADFLRGGTDDDTLAGGLGNDRLDGDAGDDSFVAGAAPDGADAFNGADGRDVLSYAARAGAVRVALDGTPGNGELGEGDLVGTDIEDVAGGGGNDSLTGNGEFNVLAGNGGRDSIDGGGGPDTIRGGLDDDVAAGGEGDDTVLGDSGGDALDGGPGADVVGGGEGDDALDGGAGPDSVAGGEGGDALAGGDGADALDGGTGDDALDGGAGPDILAGGDGRDLANYGNRIENLAISLDGLAGDGGAGEGDNVGVDVEDVRGGAGADTFTGSAAPNALDGGAGEDYMDGAAGLDSLTGGPAGDVARTRDGAEDRLGCGDGPDFVVGDAADVAAADCERIDRGVRQRPVIRSSALVAPVRGSLAMSPTGIVRRVPLQDRVVLPLRSIVDTAAGSVKVTSAASVARRQTAEFFDGAFNIVQTAGRLPVTQLALVGGDFSACPAAGRARAAQARRTIRKLWGNGKGRFRTRGRYAAASIRGTRWQITDRCDGTLVRVTRGTVTVRDLTRRRTVVVRAGSTYLARAR